MSSASRSIRRPRIALPAGVAAMTAILAVSILGIVPAIAVPATPGPGYQDYVYKADTDTSTGGNDVQSFRNQSKLWFNDGLWWGILFDRTTASNGTYRIQSFNMATQTWGSSTSATAVDNRNRSHADALWDGTSLWIVSSHVQGRNWAPNGDLRLYKFSYSAATKKYTKVVGFPKTIATNGPDPDPVNKVTAAYGTIAATIVKAFNGDLWVAYVQATSATTAVVKVVHSTTGTSWSAPFTIPGMGTAATPNDQAAITTVGTNGVGVLWSNQTAGQEAFYFAAHTDTAAEGSWGARETAFGGSGTLSADGHISLKTDSTGRVIAAIKTSKVTGVAPLIDVLARTGQADAVGAWTNRIVSSVTQKGTRPVLVIDSEASEANVFITDTSTPGAQQIVRRTAPLATLDFGAAAIGTPFIKATSAPSINNSTSTKQITTAASGIVVLAANIPTRTYFHGCAGSICPLAPTAAFSGLPTSGEAPLTVQFTDESTGNPATWDWNFGDGSPHDTTKNPSHTFNTGTWTVSLTVTNVLGTNTVTKTGYITATLPTAATYTAIAPVRVMDSRDGTGGISTKFVNGTPQTFLVWGGTIPATAVAITGNLTVTGQSKAGFVFLGPSASPSPSSSTLNFPVGDTRANAVTVGLDSTGHLSAVYKSSTAGATTNLFLDVTGYFVKDTLGSRYNAIAPVRVMDSRDGTGGISTKFVNGTPQTFLATGGSVPATATAITGNLTVTGQSNAGFVFLGPTATSSPTSSTLNFPVGDTRANAVTVQLDGTGHLSAVYKSSTAGATTHLFLDITGYFDSTGSRYIALSPVRVMDSRTNLGVTGKFVNGTPKSFVVATVSGPVPTSAVAITGNLTVTGQSKAGFAFLGPTATSSPTSSTLNFPFGDTRANAVTVGLASNGLQAVYKSSTAGATTNLFLDVTGYFVP